MAITSAIVAVTGIAISAEAASKARKATKERGEVQSAEQRNRDAAALRQQAREERIKRARILQASEEAGTGGASREIGAVSALRTQVSANVGRIAGGQRTAAGISDLNQDIASAQAQQQLGAGLTSVGQFAFSEFDGFDNLFK